MEKNLNSSHVPELNDQRYQTAESLNGSGDHQGISQFDVSTETENLKRILQDVLCSPNNVSIPNECLSSLEALFTSKTATSFGGNKIGNNDEKKCPQQSERSHASDGESYVLPGCTKKTDSRIFKNKVGEDISVFQTISDQSNSDDTSTLIHQKEEFRDSSLLQEHLRSNLIENQMEKAADGETIKNAVHLISSFKKLGVDGFQLPKRPKICSHTEADERFMVKSFLQTQKNQNQSTRRKAPLRLKQSFSACTMREYNLRNRELAAPLMLKRFSVLAPFIEENLKATHPRLKLSYPVCQRIEILLRDILYRIGEEAEILTTLSENKTITPQVLKYAVKFCLEDIKKEADVASGKKTPWML